jgi:hypothetical protein
MMINKIPTFCLRTAGMLCAFVNFILGCAASTRAFIDRENVPQFAGAKIIKLTLTNGNVLKFDRDGGRYYEHYGSKKRVIVGRTENDQKVAISLDRVLKAYVESDGATAESSGLLFPTVLLVGLAVAIF